MRYRRTWALGLAAAVLLTACSPAVSDPGNPGMSSDDPLVDRAVEIRRDDFQITFNLDGVSVGGLSVGLISLAQLTFVASVAVGDPVERGQRVGAAVIDPVIERSLDVNGAGSIDTARLERLRGLEGPIDAPVGGVFGFHGTTPIVQSPGIDVVVALTPIQDLRYRSLRFSGEAVIETIAGERQVDCDALWIQAPELADESDAGAAPSSSALHCRLPAHIETAPGLRARVILKSELMKGAIVVPNVFVGYDKVTDGYFVNVVLDGEVSKVPVTVGVTDGVLRVITSDVLVGAELVPLEEQ